MVYRLKSDGQADRSVQHEALDESVSCAICGTQANKIRSVEGHYSNTVFSIVQCQTCGLIFVNPRLNKEFRDFCYGREKHLVEWFLTQADEARLNAQKVLEDLRKLGCKDGCLLDIGCGIGAFLAVSELHGFKPIGIELNENTAKYAAKDHDVIHGDFSESALPEASVDVVIIEQTLEHLSNPYDVLEKAWHLLKPAGYLYIGVPGIDSLRLWSDRFIGFGKSALWSPEDHLYYFLPKTIEQLLIKVGFKPLQIPKPGLKGRIKDVLGLSQGKFYAQKREAI